MNDSTDGASGADRLRLALDDSRHLRAQLAYTLRTTRALVDAFNTEVRNGFTGEATASAIDAAWRSTASESEPPLPAADR